MPGEPLRVADCRTHGDVGTQESNVHEDLVATFDELDADPRGTTSPEEEACAAHRRETLRALVGGLPELQAETFALRVALGYSLQEVAETTGVPLNTVRSRLRLAKEHCVVSSNAIRLW